MDLTQTVRDTAVRQFLVDEDGKLVLLDSLTLIDFVGELEKATGLVIPTSAIRTETFETIENVAAMLEGLGDGG